MMLIVKPTSEPQSNHSRSPSSPPPHPPTSRRRISWSLWGSVVIGGGFTILALGLIVQPSRQQGTEPLAPVERATLRVTVSSNGTIEPEQLVNISPESSGILKALLVEEGEQVEAGQILARMDDHELQAQLKQAQGRLAAEQANLDRLLAGNRAEDIAQAQARLDQARANLAKLEAGSRAEEIAQAQARLDQTQATRVAAEADVNRIRILAEQGAVSQQELDQAEASYEQSLAQVVEAEQALVLLQSGSRREDVEQARAQVYEAEQSLALLQAGARSEDIRQAQAQVLTASGSLEEMEARVESTILRAPFAGIVTRKYADPGAFVTPTTSGSAESSATSTSILALASSTQHAVANIAEVDIAQIQLGQTVYLEADAYPDQSFTGTVIQLSPQAIESQNVTSFEVKTAIHNDDQRQLRIGMNVDLEFQVGQLEDVLVVPSVAIVRTEEGTGVYTVHSASGPQFTPITTGLTVDDRTEVHTGLTGSEQVLLSFPPGLRDQASSRSFLMPFAGGGGSPNRLQRPGGGPL